MGGQQPEEGAMPVRSGEYDFLLGFSTGGPGNHCGCCGKRAGEPHDKNCISQVPDMIPLWRRGFEAQMRAGYGKQVKPHEPLDLKADEAFGKGVLMALQKLAAGITKNIPPQVNAHP
jgi:hypothetical protein